MEHMEPCKDSWRGRDSNGYHTMFKKKYGYIREHRYLYMKYHNVKLTPKDEVRHTCDNKWCIEITHLILGTHADNMNDAVIRNRFKRGSKRADTFLTEAQIKKMRRLYKSGKYTQADLAEEFGMAQQTVSKILNYKTWKHVE